MKRALIVSFALFLAAFAIPLLTAGQQPAAGDTNPSPAEQTSPAPSPPPEAPTPAAEETPLSGNTEPPITDTVIPILHDGGIRQIPLRDYLYGALTAEMPPLYPEEALKAQAVAIRTLVCYASEHPYHGEAWLCSDPECCLAYAPLEDNRASWGDEYDTYAAIARAAVDSTDGEVIAYLGEPIEAVFFSASPGGKTRSAAEVWGAEVPYLQSVDSPFDDDFPGGAHGHGVGMSQFGARQLALDGMTYKEILLWYYTGVEVVEEPPPG
ncbi:MAG: SpoIID/LytB domain-containing protein [Oscillospiraceae bacterium]|jgi:stage II sporulation protein D|nr:SpoIID/LytB domain-containing protein [Oscillospiraceae bacterium]